MGETQNKSKVNKKWSISSLFMCADSIDLCLMGLGCVGTIADGITVPLLMILISKFMNNFGTGIDTSTTNKNAMLLLYLACMAFVAGILGNIACSGILRVILGSLKE
ncbi:hypothetical protein ACFE04_008990 [Oxalis oulophora]